MNEPSVIPTEQTIVRTGRWIMAFGGVCIARLILDLLTLPHGLIFSLSLAVSIVAILTGEAVARKRGWALVSSMFLGGLLIGASVVGTGAMVIIGWRDWVVYSPSTAIEEFGPFILIGVIVLAFWWLVIGTLLKASAVLRVQGSRLPSRRLLWTWLGASLAVGVGLARAVVVQVWIASRY